MARVRLYPGTGQIVVNGRSPEEHFGARVIHERIVTAPLRVTETVDRWNVMVKVVGGGVDRPGRRRRHGIARALVDADKEAYARPLKRPACSPATPASKSARRSASSAPARPRSTPSANPLASGRRAPALLPAREPLPRGAAFGAFFAPVDRRRSLV